MEFHNIWSLFDVRSLRLANTNFNISQDNALRQNLLGVLAGDVAYSLGPGAGVHFNCAKEDLVTAEDRDDVRTEQWKMKVSDVHLPTEKDSAAMICILKRYSYLPAGSANARGARTRQHLHELRPREGQMQFAHTALVQLLAWEKPAQDELNWRQLLRAPKIVKSIKDFRAALDV